MELATALEFAKSRREGILTTLRVDGAPSCRTFSTGSVTTACSHLGHRHAGQDENLRRDPRAASMWAGQLLGLRRARRHGGALGGGRHVDDAVVDELVEMYRSFVASTPTGASSARHCGRPAPRAATLPTSAYGQIDR